MRDFAAVYEEGRFVAIAGRTLSCTNLKNGGDNGLPCRVASTGTHLVRVREATATKEVGR